MKHRKNLTDTRVVLTSLLVSVSDVVLNLVVGIITGSTTILSQSLQGISDLLTALVLFVGVRRSKKVADTRHPLGYGREIFFWVLIAGMFMFVGTGMLSLLLGLSQILNPEQLSSEGLAVIMLSFGLCTNLYAFSKSHKRLERSAGKKKLLTHFKESSMIETKATFVVDFLGSLSALLGLIAIVLYLITNNPVFDGLGSLVVGLSMMCAAGLLVYDTRALIIGKAVPASVEAKIRNATLSFPKVEEIVELRCLYLGSSNIVILLELHLDDSLTTNQIERLIDKIKLAIREKVPNVYTAQIEVETPNRELNT